MAKTVLITGADGNIGTALRNALASKYSLRLLTLAPLPDAATTVANISDLQAIKPAFTGVDSVVHLAADPRVHSPWDSILHNNIIGTYNVFEAAHQAGVKQLIFASSNHAVGLHYQRLELKSPLPDDKVISREVMVGPDSLYGVSKCFGESLGAYYAHYRGMHVICLRIGWITKDDYPRGKVDEAGAAMWQSKRDFIQMVEKCIEADHIKFDIFYGVSNNPYRFFDLDHAREQLGYVPQDSSLERIQEHS